MTERKSSIGIKANANMPFFRGMLITLVNINGEAGTYLSLRSKSKVVPNVLRGSLTISKFVRYELARMNSESETVYLILQSFLRGFNNVYDKERFY